MFAIYSFLFTLGFLALLPRFLYDALSRGKYVSGFRERMGDLTPLPAGQPVIWLHCVSVGETQAARPLARKLLQEFPNHRLVISTITLTGQRLAREVFKNTAAKIFYFPFDWAFTANRTINRINPAAVFLMETEIWPGFIRSCKRRGIPVSIVNGRLSERSFRRYRLVRPFISRVLSMVDLAVMQSPEDAKRIADLGMDPSKIHQAGNLKFDVGTINVSEAATRELQSLLGESERPLLVAASTHPPEERILLEAFQRIFEAFERKPRLLIAPRHPERFKDVATLMSATGLSWMRRTQSATNADADLILLDTIGELPATYQFAEIVFVGGSIAKTGGHNVLEPAAAGSCIITGAHTFNFGAIIREFVEKDALIQLPPLSEGDAAEELAHTFSTLLGNPDRRAELRRNSKSVVQQNIGATERTLELVAPLVSSLNSSHKQHLNREQGRPA